MSDCRGLYSGNDFDRYLCGVPQRTRNGFYRCSGIVKQMRKQLNGNKPAIPA